MNTFNFSFCKIWVENEPELLKIIEQFANKLDWKQYNEFEGNCTCLYFNGNKESRYYKCNDEKFMFNISELDEINPIDLLIEINKTVNRDFFYTLDSLVNYKPKEWRYGQAYFNYASILFPNEASQLRGSQYDCFHNDSKIEVFKTELYKLI